MSNSNWEVFLHDDEVSSELARKFGHLALLLSASPKHAHMSLADIRKLVLPALRNSCAKVYFNSDGAPVAFFIWAHLAPDVERRFLRSGVVQLHESEWNEGSALWVLDAGAPYGNFRYALRRFIKDMDIASEFAYCRRRRGGTQFKSIDAELICERLAPLGNCPQYFGATNVTNV